MGRGKNKSKIEIRNLKKKWWLYNEIILQWCTYVCENDRLEVH